MTKFILDSGDPDEYQEAIILAKSANQEIWGSTTNPSLIAKKLTGKKLTRQEAFALQRDLVLEILGLVPGAVSAEVYADTQTSAEQMIEQGRDIASWDDRVVVKLPTTVAGFMARNELRKQNITTNNTLVFSQEQIFAICLHEQIMQKQFGVKSTYPPFISPFVGRLEGIGIDGMQLVAHGMKIKSLFTAQLWMLEASVRSVQHIRSGVQLQTELLTAPLKTYQEWFRMLPEQQGSPVVAAANLKPIPYLDIQKDLLVLDTIDSFMEAVTSDRLNIKHELTDKGIVKFAEDWQAILATNE